MFSSILQLILRPSNSKLYSESSPGSELKVYRKVNAGLSTEATSLLPFYINYLGGNWTEASQCASGGSNSWFNNHLALNGDLNDQWAWDNTAMSWTHFQRQDLPLHFALAEGWTLADMYQVNSFHLVNSTGIVSSSDFEHAGFGLHVDIYPNRLNRVNDFDWSQPSLFGLARVY